MDARVITLSGLTATSENAAEAAASEFIPGNHF
jgi:hypothetical protein